MRASVVGAVLLTAVPWTLGPGRESTAATRIVLEPVATGLASPLYVTHARDGSGRLFIVEQAGRIKVLAPGAVTPTIFLDLSARVLAGGEQGLLGLAFHPDFARNGRLFVDYTRRPDGATVVAEYRVSPSDPARAAPEELLILVVPQPFANHNGGMIEFGPEGFLYVGMGDGGSENDPGNRAQNADELLGKLLRIDVDHPSVAAPYSSPATNPFAGPAPGRDEIFAVGVRNPWRFSFDRATGQLYVADVGQGAFEEIDLVTVGANLGWRVLEGRHCTGLDPALCASPELTPPIAEYAHTGGRCSITGGYVYRGVKGTLPAGAYVYGDFCSGEIFMLDGGTQRVLLATGLAIASFGEDGAGELYVVDLGGSVHRIVNPDAIRLALTLDRSTIRPDEVLTIDVTGDNPGPEAMVDVYLGALLPVELGAGCPGRDPAVFLSDGGARMTVACLSGPPVSPYARNVVVAVGQQVSRALLTLRWPAGAAPGRYVPFIAYTRPGGTTLFDVIAVGAATLSAVP
jgi:glucose/arabinose dehydrogenase